jgi:stage V sporulation protein AD
MRVLRLKNPPSVVGFASVVGGKEYHGPLGAEFDLHDETGKFGMDTWEKSESEMQRLALNLALAKGKCLSDAPQVIFAGDLMNQCTGSAYGLLGFGKPYFGLYGACSTFAEATALSALLISAGYFDSAAAISSSHFCSAERQFRFPLEYGGQRAPTAQWTATAAGAAILSSTGSGPYVTEVLPGAIVDKGISDVNNMGAAMAPAAIDTLTAYFTETGKQPNDFDLILTGDLGLEGHGITLTLMKNAGWDMTGVYNDCGLLLYGAGSQDVHCGGSGCGCSASVICGHILKRLERGELKNVLYLATGALMSPSSLKQGATIPGIAHLVHFSAEKPGEEK